MYRVGLPKEVSGIVLSRSFNCSQGNRRAVVLAITALSQQGCLPRHQNVEEPMYQMFETNNQGTHVMPCIWQHCLNSLFILQISCEQFLNPWCWAPQPAIAPYSSGLGGFTIPFCSSLHSARQFPPWQEAKMLPNQNLIEKLWKVLQNSPTLCRDGWLSTNQLRIYFF